ncbi:MAG: HAD-IA family hydrolase [Pseudomonadota bacterium]
MSRRLVLFDCDGTLVDSQHVIHEAMSFAFLDHGLSPLPRQDVRRVIGLPLDTAIAQLHPVGSSDQVAGLARSYKEAFVQLRQRVGHHEPLFDGMREVIETLDDQGALLGIVTGKGSQGLAMVLAQHDLTARFVTLQTADTAPGKPDPGMVNQAIAETGALAADTVVVGDTTFDMAMAVAAGVPAIGVAWGYHPSDHLIAAGARCIVDHPTDLHGVIDDLMASAATV